MLEIENTHIQELDDKMLRDLIGLLCEEELKKFETGVRNVFWGGNQTAADGGIDVRCEYEGDVYSNSFLPRNKTGFQVKLSDYKPNQILNEMQDKGILKESIQDLCKNNGAYILVCGKSSVSDQMYKNRIDAMKKAVQGYEGSESVCLDFFDGNRIATWLRNYPALIIWVREKTSRPLEGWRAYGEWSDTQKKDYKGYIIDEEKRLYDYMEDKEITVLEGIQKFRDLINKGSAIIRLTGLSGVGKTRFLEELFDENVGVNALDSSKVIYADAAETLTPCAEQMVRELILKNEKVILILDNCGAKLHSVLMKICKTEETREVSLITVEYDVQEQNIEETETFVLKPASDVTIEELIVKNYKNIPLPTIKRIVEISGGNARLALLFATSLLKYNKNINAISNSELFKRLFWQRGQEDKELRKTAEVFSMLYSVNYEDEGEDGELRKLCELAELTLKEARFNLEELKKRELLQTRGKWCAVLPHALSNYLAINAIQCYRENILAKELIENGTERMKKSFAHRLTFLGNDDIVIKISEQWLDKEFSNIVSLQLWQMECFYYLAQVNPYKVLKFIKQNWSGLSDNSFQKHRCKLIISALAYYPEYFIECMKLLEKEKTRILDIGQYFQYTIFMNPECADKRYELIKFWLKDGKEELGLECLMKTLECGWNTGNEFYVSNRSLKENQEEDKEYWFSKFSGYIKELIMTDRFDKIIFLPEFAIKVFRLFNQGFSDACVEIATEIRRKMFWKKGFIVIQQKLYYENMHSGDTVEKMQNVVELLKPQNADEEIIYWCTSDTVDVYYCSGDNTKEIFERHERKIKHYAKMLANDFSLFQRVSKELVMSRSYLLFSLGKELAISSFRDQIWDKICDIMQETGTVYGGMELLKGLISEERNDGQAKRKLGVLVQNVNLLPTYISIVAHSDFFHEELGSFLEVVQTQKVDIAHFQILAYCENFLNLPLDDFLLCINSLLIYENSDVIIWNLCANKLTHEKKKAGEIEESIKKEILSFLVKSKVSMYNRKKGNLGDITNHNIKTIISLSCDSLINEHLQYISLFYSWIWEDTQENYKDYDVSEIFDELYKLQPILFLETFIEKIEIYSNVMRIVGDRHNIRKSPLLQNNLEYLVSWCNVKPDERYNKVFRCTHGYESLNKQYQWNNVVPLAMNHVKDRKGLALKLMESIDPTYTNTSWSAERELRESLFDLFESDRDDEVAELAKNRRKEYREITEQYRKREMENEKLMQRFE